MPAANSSAVFIETAASVSDTEVSVSVSVSAVISAVVSEIVSVSETISVSETASASETTSLSAVTSSTGASVIWTAVTVVSAIGMGELLILAIRNSPAPAAAAITTTAIMTAAVFPPLFLNSEAPSPGTYAPISEKSSFAGASFSGFFSGSFFSSCFSALGASALEVSAFGASDALETFAVSGISAASETSEAISPSFSVCISTPSILTISGMSSRAFSAAASSISAVSSGDISEGSMP